MRVPLRRPGLACCALLGAWGCADPTASVTGPGDAGGSSSGAAGSSATTGDDGPRHTGGQPTRDSEP
ncbi:MAG: hypothetical protein K0V04_28640, partial [Deltaproteobacteria bacterium]|nr:hypothetical protein [Deltaproteobacteria bacterium]